MKLQREQFLQKLQQVSPGLASSEVGGLDQSTCFVFKKDRIITFNDEVMCSTDFECGIEGAAHAKQLISLLGKLADETIDVKSDGGNLLVVGRHERAGITFHQEILLPVDAVEEPKEWGSLNPEFSDAVEIVQGSASTDDLYFALTCVHITDSFVEACDGYQVARYSMETGVSPRCLIKRSSAKSLIGMGVNQVSQGKNWIHFRCDTTSISCRKSVADYINVGSILDFEGRPITLPGGLAEAIDKAEIFSSDNQAENQVMVQIKGNKLRLRGEGAHGWYEERKKVEYDGEPLLFYAAPKLLSLIAHKTNDCKVSNDRIMIDAGKFVFVACLGTPVSSAQ